MSIRACFPIAVVLFLCPAAAGADPLDSALNDYKAGNFLEAASGGAALESAPGSTLAARALLVEAAYRADEDRAGALLDEALGHTADALHRDPDYVEAMLYRVIALGYLSRRAGNTEAHRAGWGDEAKMLWEQAETLEPNNAWMHSIKGGWHAEIADEAGSILASLMYGASRRKAIDAYEKAVALAPGNPVIRVEFARALLRLSIRKYREDARAQLSQGLALEAEDVFQQLVMEQGRALLTAIETGDRKEVRRVFEETDAFRN